MSYDSVSGLKENVASLSIDDHSTLAIPWNV